MESMYSNSVWELVDPPENVRPIGCKWIFKKKRGVDGKVETFKVRLVAKGYHKRKGVDYEETFYPVAMLKSIRIFLSIAAALDYKIWQIDVKTAFLNGYLEESIYMEQLEGSRYMTKSKKFANCSSQFIDLNKHQGHGILSLMKRSRPMASNKMLMSLVCTSLSIMEA